MIKNIIKELLLEADKRNIITDKIGLDKQVADWAYNLSRRKHLWIVNSLIDDIIDKNSTINGKNEAIKYINNKFNTIRTRYSEKYTTIFDWLVNSQDANVNLKSYNFEEAYNLAQEWHNTRKAGGTFKNEDGKVLFTYPNGYYWVDLQRKYCEIEAKTMGHCAKTTKGTTLLSFRKELSDGTIKSHLTVSYNENDKLVYQLKGGGNIKPKEEYHQYIVDLFINFDIEGINSEHDPKNDFAINDLSLKLFNNLIKAKGLNFLLNILPKDLGKCVDKFNINDVDIKKMFSKYSDEEIYRKYNSESYNNEILNNYIRKRIETFLGNIPFAKRLEEGKYILTESDLEALKSAGIDNYELEYQSNGVLVFKFDFDGDSNYNYNFISSVDNAIGYATREDSLRESDNMYGYFDLDEKVKNKIKQLLELVGVIIPNNFDEYDSSSILELLTNDSDIKIPHFYGFDKIEKSIDKYYDSYIEKYIEELHEKINERVGNDYGFLIDYKNSFYSSGYEYQFILDLALITKNEDFDINELTTNQSLIDSLINHFENMDIFDYVSNIEYNEGVNIEYDSLNDQFYNDLNEIIENLADDMDIDFEKFTEKKDKFLNFLKKSNIAGFKDDYGIMYQLKNNKGKIVKNIRVKQFYPEDNQVTLSINNFIPEKEGWSAFKDVKVPIENAYDYFTHEEIFKENKKFKNIIKNLIKESINIFKEDILTEEELLEASESIPTDKKKYANAKAYCKKRYDVIPSKYYSGCIVKRYKSTGGSYKKKKK